MNGAQLAAIRSPLTGPPDSANNGPTPRFVGDLWFCTAAGGAFLTNALYEHDGTAWMLASIPNGNFAVPALTLGTANAAGVANTGIRSDATIAAFDATVPVVQAFGDAAATGTAATAARRDHKHGMPSVLTNAASYNIVSIGPLAANTLTDVASVSLLANATYILLATLIWLDTGSAAAGDNIVARLFDNAAGVSITHQGLRTPVSWAGRGQIALMKVYTTGVAPAIKLQVETDSGAVTIEAANGVFGFGNNATGLSAIRIG